MIQPLLADDSAFAVLAVFLVLVFAIGAFLWRSNRGQTVMEKWAAEQGVRIIACERRGLMRGPFFLTTSKGQMVYRVSAQFPDGRIGHAWVRCGSWIGGMLSDQTDTRWDEEVPRRDGPGFPVIMPEAKKQDGPPGFPVVFPGEPDGQPPDRSRRS